MCWKCNAQLASARRRSFALGPHEWICVIVTELGVSRSACYNSEFGLLLLLPSCPSVPFCLCHEMTQCGYALSRC